MKGGYWFNVEPISKNVDIIFEYEEYQFINEIVHLLSIEELKTIIDSIREHVDSKRPYVFRKEYFSINLDFALCTVEYELPGQFYRCFIDGVEIANIFKKYVYKYDHGEDIFRSL